ncbi:MAG TPA: tripartite tricarboxylate transporter substrate binding protein [Eoetvoesiella sp.]
MKSLSRYCVFAIAAAIGLIVSPAIAADGFPSRAVRIIVPFTPGGSADTSARILATKLTEIWRQPVIVESKPGGGTTIASAYVAQAAPDGYTLYLAYGLSYATSASLYKNLSYDPKTSLAPVSMVADAPFILSVPQGSSVGNVADLIEQGKSGSLMYASTGIGAGPHLTTESFLRRSGIKALHVPYKGTAGAMTSLMANEVQFSVFDAAALGNLRGGKIRPIAVTSAKRWAILPEVPTIAESGFPGFDITSGSYILVPGQVPKDIVAQLNTAIVKALASPDVEKQFAALGFTAISSTPEKLRQTMTKDMERLSVLIDTLGLTAN